jgi:hypothetical protein
MIRLLSLLALGAVTGASLSVAGAAFQDPLVVSPAAYRLEFENGWVRVVRVRYEPKSVIAPHFHTEQASAYVYLNDGGPILLKHEGLPYAGVTRPATKAGSFRIYKGLKEVHSVENPTDTPSEFLRVEFKTEPLEEGLLRGKFFREDPARMATVQRIQFENAQVRITRVVVAPEGRLEVRASPTEPALLVALTTGQVAEPFSEGDARRLGAGQTTWLGADASAKVIGGGSGPSEMLRFDFKTKPRERLQVQEAYRDGWK